MELKTGSPLLKDLDAIKIQGQKLSPGSYCSSLDIFFNELNIQITEHHSAVKKHSTQVDALKKLLDNRYAKPLRLDNFAEELYLNKFSLVKGFKKQYGISPMAYLLERRIKESCRLLLNTRLTVTRIGCKVGLENTTYFIRAFKQRTGYTPLSYRKKYQQQAQM